MYKEFALSGDVLQSKGYYPNEVIAANQKGKTNYAETKLADEIQLVEDSQTADVSGQAELVLNFLVGDIAVIINTGVE